MGYPNKSTLGGCLIIMAVLLIVIGSWGINFSKLTDCDFVSPYKCEVIHGVGLIPPLQLIMVWFDTDVDTTK